MNDACLLMARCSSWTCRVPGVFRGMMHVYLWRIHNPYLKFHLLFFHTDAPDPP